MTLSGILSSPSQRRTFLLTSALIILVSILTIGAISLFAPDTRGWNATNSLLISVVASGVFALVSGLYISYFFVDPTELANKFTLLPEDIGQALRDMASRATNYKIYVRTGRHFRAEILPLLVEQARRSRQQVRIEVILLDFRDRSICEKYAEYRKSSSFDRQIWKTDYVQKEVLATILKLILISNENRTLIEIDLFLSKRLSTFRIEGNSEEVLVTREDPKDSASRYLRTHRDFAAFANEFRWTKDEAYQVRKVAGGGLDVSLQAMFGELPVIAELESLAIKATTALSPYAR